MTSQDYNTAMVNSLSKTALSPLKKVKRKVGYNKDAEKRTEVALKKLCLEDSTGGPSAKMNVD